MKKLDFSAAMATILIFWSITVFAGSTMWVTSENAKLKAEPKASSKTLCNLTIGTKISVWEKKRKWYRLQTASGQKGWIYRGKLSDSPPAKETESSDNLFSSMQSSSISADEAQTSRSIRGLSKETAQYAKKRKTPKVYQKALDQVLAIRITNKEVENFLKSGKIGEYAP